MFGHIFNLKSDIILITSNLALLFCLLLFSFYCQYFKLTKKVFILLLLQVLDFLEIMSVEQKETILKLNK